MDKESALEKLLEDNYRLLLKIDSETAFQIAVDTMLQQARQIIIQNIMRFIKGIRMTWNYKI